MKEWLIFITENAIVLIDITRADHRAHRHR